MLARGFSDLLFFRCILKANRAGSINFLFLCQVRGHVGLEVLDIDAILDDVDCPKKSSKSSPSEHPDNCGDDREDADEDNDTDEDVVVERNP